MYIVDITRKDEPMLNYIKKEIGRIFIYTAFILLFLSFYGTLQAIADKPVVFDVNIPALDEEVMCGKGGC